MIFYIQEDLRRKSGAWKKADPSVPFHKPEVCNIHRESIQLTHSLVELKQKPIGKQSSNTDDEGQDWTVARSTSS